MHWKVNRIQYPVFNLGPGRRLALWVQGCSLRCPGCLNPTLWNSRGGRPVDVLRLVHGITGMAGRLDGVTITGGEPFDQYEALVLFCSFLRRTGDLDVFVYSGYTLAELEKRFPDRLYRHCVDYLMDGRYEASLHEDRNVRGSSNQRLYRFVDGRAVELDAGSLSTRTWSVHVSQDREVFMAGIPRAGELETIRDELSMTGIDIHFV